MTGYAENSERQSVQNRSRVVECVQRLWRCSGGPYDEKSKIIIQREPPFGPALATSLHDGDTLYQLLAMDFMNHGI